MKLYRFQMCNSIINHLYMALCAHQPKSNLPLSQYIWPPLLFTIPQLPFPSSNHHAVICVWVLVCLSCLICFFMSDIWVKSYGSWLFSSGLFCLAWYSEDLSTLTQMAVFHPFLWLNSISWYTCTMTSLSNHLSKDTSIVFMSWQASIMLQCTQGCMYLCK